MASNSLYGNQYSGVEIVQFQWFIFQSSSTAPATPTGGSWNFQTGVGTPPSGWSDAPPASPSNEVWVSIALVSSLSPSTFTWSAPGLWYQQGAAGQVAVGTTTTLSPGASATVNNSGTSYNAVLNFGIPQGIQGPTGSTGPTGPTGPTGSAATIAVGTTTTLSSGSSATVNNSGSSSAATFNFGIPQVIPGTAATIAVGTTTTTNPGTSATVTNSGTSGAAVFNFGIPKGAGVSSGGTTGQALIKNSNADYDTTWTTITGILVFQGSWNASTNTPTLTSSVGTNGYYYIVSVAGTTNLNGITDWQPNDWAIFNGSVWEKIDNTDLVTSVNSYTGAVVLTNTDVGAPTYAGVGATGTWPISVTGNSATVTNGVYTSGSYSNPTWITGLAGSKVTAIPNSSLTNSSLTIGSTNIALGATSTSLAGISQITFAGSVSGTSVLQAAPVATSATSILPSVAGVLINSGGTGVVTNTMLSNSTISGISLGSNLANLTAGTNVTFSSGSTYNGSTAITINASSTMVYPSAGIPNSTGSAWGTSYSTTGSGTVLALATSPTFVTPVLGTPTSGNFSTGTFTWPTFNQNTTGTASNVTGTVSVANGGTGLTSLTAGYIPYGNGTSAYSSSSGFTFVSNVLTTPVLIVNSTTSTTPNLTFNASNSGFTSGASVSGSYLQTVIQNKSGTAGASTNYVLSNDLGTDSTYYGEFGMNSSVYTGAGVPSDFYSINNGIYFSGHDGDISIGSGNGKNLYFAWGSSGQYAHVINSSGAIGLNTNLSAGTGSGTTNYGTTGQVITSQGSSATPTWTTLSIGGGTF